VHRIATPEGWQAPPGQSQVSLSSGVVLADQHTPIFFLRRLVEELLKTAKARAKDLRDNHFYGATIDFLALKSFNMIATNIEDLRKNALRRGRMSLTAKPYSLPELRALLDAVRTLKQTNFPTSQLYRLREQLSTGWLASTVDYLYLQTRSPHAAALQSVFDRWSGCEPHGRVGPTGMWLRHDEDTWETVLRDIVELYDFVPVQGEYHGA
jgi:CRISPR-associated protein Cmr2